MLERFKYFNESLYLENMQELKNIGLTDGEIKVYIALLELGPSTNSPVTNKTRMQSSSVYYCLNSLVSKGFVSYVIKARKKYFEAVEPETILEIVDEKIKETQKEKENIRTVLPKLKLHQKFAKKQHLAVVYEGFKGFRTIFNDILQKLDKGDTYYAFGIEQRIQENKALRIFFLNHNREIKKRGIKLKLLAHERMRPVYYKMYGKQFLALHELRFTTELTPVAITIYKDNVVTHVWEGDEPMSFLMRNKQVSANYKNYFEEVWKRAKG